MTGNMWGMVSTKLFQRELNGQMTLAQIDIYYCFGCLNLEKDPWFSMEPFTNAFCWFLCSSVSLAGIGLKSDPLFSLNCFN